MPVQAWPLFHASRNIFAGPVEGVFLEYYRGMSFENSLATLPPVHQKLLYQNNLDRFPTPEFPLGASARIIIIRCQYRSSCPFPNSSIIPRHGRWTSQRLVPPALRKLPRPNKGTTTTSSIPSPSSTQSPGSTSAPPNAFSASTKVSSATTVSTFEQPSRAPFRRQQQQRMTPQSFQTRTQTCFRASIVGFMPANSIRIARLRSYTICTSLRLRDSCDAFKTPSLMRC